MNVWASPAKQNVIQTGMVVTFLYETCVMNAATQVARPDEKTKKTDERTDGRVCVDDVHVGK